MRILLCGPYFSDIKGTVSLHNAEVGITNGLIELGHELFIFDPRHKIFRWSSGQVGLNIDDFNINIDICICPGCGANPFLFSTAFWKETKAKKINWNSEPLMLPEYFSKLQQQKNEFHFFFTFDEAEIPIYQSLGIEKIAWLPQAANTEWYKPLGTEPVADICFVGSIGNKWANREHLISRVRMSSPINVAQGIFNAPMINRYYNAHKLVLNLGLYIPELGPIEKLKGSGYQQRLFESILSGSVAITNEINTPNPIFTHAKDILFYNSSNLEEVIRFGIDIKENFRMKQNILNIREQHTYKTRMEQMLKMIETM